MLGTQTAYAWVRCGHRTLEDLRAAESTLTRSQRIGLKYYDEFLDRMPRTEAAAIEATVVTANASRSNTKMRGTVSLGLCGQLQASVGSNDH